MRRSAIILVVLGLGLALASTAGVFYLLQQQTSQAVVPPTATPVPMVKVVVAAQDIPERTAIRTEMVTVKDWPKQLVPAGTLSDPNDAIGAVASHRIVAGELILAQTIAGEVAEVGLAPEIPSGLVAIVLSLRPENAAGGTLRDGDSVDALLSLDYSLYNEAGDSSKNLFVTFYTIQDVRVLHVWGAASPTPTASSPASSATASSSPSGLIMVGLMVTPQDALLVKYAREKGTIDLVLRSPLYHDQVVTDPVYLDYIMRRFDIPRPVIIRQATQKGAGQ